MFQPKGQLLAMDVYGNPRGHSEDAGSDPAILGAARVPQLGSVDHSSEVLTKLRPTPFLQLQFLKDQSAAESILP